MAPIIDVMKEPNDGALRSHSIAADLAAATDDRAGAGTARLLAASVAAQTSQSLARHRALREAKLYLCTDARTRRGDLTEFLHAAFEGGVDIIQLRDKAIDARAVVTATETLAEVTAAHRQQGKLFAVNDRADIAVLTDADILHVGQEDLTTEQARQIIGSDMILGRSNRNLPMFADSIEDSGIDYGVIGPIWETPTKPGRKPIGLEPLAGAADLAEVNDKPWWAIGGIDQSNIGEVLDAGAGRVVVVRAITDAATPEEAYQRARELKSALLAK